MIVVTSLLHRTASVLVFAALLASTLTIAATVAAHSSAAGDHHGRTGAQICRSGCDSPLKF